MIIPARVPFPIPFKKSRILTYVDSKPIVCDHYITVTFSEVLVLALNQLILHILDVVCDMFMCIHASLQEFSCVAACLPIVSA